MVAPPFFSNHVETSPEQELEKNLPTDGGSRDPKHKKPPLAIKPALNKPPLSQPTIPKRGSSSFSFRFPSWDVAAFTLPLFPELGQGFQQAGNQLPPTPTNRPFIISPETNKIGITRARVDEACNDCNSTNPDDQDCSCFAKVSFRKVY